MLGLPRCEALGRPCYEVLAGKSDFGRAVCDSACPAWKALSAGNIAGTGRMLVRTAEGARQRLTCNLVALPGGGALGTLRNLGDAIPEPADDLAGIALLVARASGEPLQQGLRDALDFLLHATAADAGEAFVAEPHGAGMVRACHRGHFRHAFDQLQRFDPGEGFPGLALSFGQPVYTTHLSEDPRFLRTRVKHEGFQAYVCAPLANRRDTLGCLALSFRRSDIDLERVLNLLRWIGTPMGLVIDTTLARMREAAAAPLRGVEAAPQQRLPQAMQAVLQEMVRISHADGGEMFVPWHARELRVAAARAGTVPGCPVLSANGIGSCPAFATGRPHILRGRRAGWPPACRATTHPAGAWCCIPMSCDGHTLGMSRLLFRHLRPSPPVESVALIEGLASRAAEKLRDVRDQLTPVRCAPGSSGGQPDTGDAGITGHAGPQARQSADSREHGLARLAIRCFGSMELSIEGMPVPAAAIHRKRVTTLLGILLTNHDRPLSRDTLIEMLWPGAGPGARTRQFHVLIHELRKLLEPQGRLGNGLYVHSDGDRYAFSTQAPSWIDTLEFCTLLERARTADASGKERAAIVAYEAAVELYRGDYLQDEPFAEWCEPAREQLREACTGALQRLSILWGYQARWDKSIGWSRRALLVDPLREEVHRTLMYALWASGRRDEAVRQFATCAHLLRERLDLTPLPETELLLRRIRATPRPPAAR